MMDDMRQWRSHKIVRAEKISGIVMTRISMRENTVHVDVDAQYLSKHKPAVGGYFVVYDDGYQSYSPAKAFEEGYTLVAGSDPTLGNPDRFKVMVAFDCFGMDAEHAHQQIDHYVQSLRLKGVTIVAVEPVYPPPAEKHFTNFDRALPERSLATTAMPSTFGASKIPTRPRAGVDRGVEPDSQESRAAPEEPQPKNK